MTESRTKITITRPGHDPVETTIEDMERRVETLRQNNRRKEIGMAKPAQIPMEQMSDEERQKLQAELEVAIEKWIGLQVEKKAVDKELKEQIDDQLAVIVGNAGILKEQREAFDPR